MTQKEINDFKKMAENLSSTMQKVFSHSHEAIKEVSKTDPEKADELLKDLSIARTSKDINVINNLIMKYANNGK